MYGAAGFQATSAATGSGKSGNQQSATQANGGAAAYGGYGAQQFYPNSYEDPHVDYTKTNTYGQQNFSFGGQSAKSDYKTQVFPCFFF